MLHFHRLGIDDGYVEGIFLGGCAPGAFLVVVEVEQFAVALTIGCDTAGGERVPSFAQRQAQGALADDAHVEGIDLGPDDGVLVAIGGHDDQGVVVDPCMGVLTAVVSVLLERLCLDDLHLIVLELQLHETVG